MNSVDSKARAEEWGIRMARAVLALPEDVVAREAGKQLLRCAFSVGANYRSACRAPSNADFIAKMGLVEEEADETMLRLEGLVELGYPKRANVESLIREADEIIAMTIASFKTARKRTASSPVPSMPRRTSESSSPSSQPQAPESQPNHRRTDCSQSPIPNQKRNPSKMPPATNQPAPEAYLQTTSRARRILPRATSR